MMLLQLQVPRLSLDTTDASSGEAFPAVVAWLEESSDHQNALRRIRGRKSAARYRSLVDFLLCEVCPEERADCFRFYREEGRRLVEIRTEKRIRFLESRLLLFLTIAYEVFCQERAVSWSAAVQMVEEICAAA